MSDDGELVDGLLVECTKLPHSISALVSARFEDKKAAFSARDAAIATADFLCACIDTAPPGLWIPQRPSSAINAAIEPSAAIP